MKLIDYHNAISALGDGAIITVHYAALTATRTITGRYRKAPANDPDCLYIAEGDRTRHIMYHRIVEITLADQRRAA